MNDIENAINEDVIAIAYWITTNTFSRGVAPSEVVKLARKRGLHTILDAAAELPPVKNLRKLVNMGFDLVILSGGKAI
ncbi:hypothetical protein J7L06_01945 [Candidatus Bathyarchaeota archaeon]|nr:hypothetical protein [Candidatus Bathyarchaeota archaeon]